MGIISSRTFLQQSGEHSKGTGYSRGKVKPISEADRLVCDELCKEIQYNFPDKLGKTRDSLSLIQVAPKGLQQKDVRSVLPLQTD